MSYYIFVDNSNVWIEGKFASAVNKKWVHNMYEAHKQNAQDQSWRIDFGKLLNFVTDGKVEDIS